MRQPVYIIDCDGVLYPQSELNTAQIIAAMKKTYREEVGLDGAEQRDISAKTIREKHLGAFNYIKEICRQKNYDFTEFCRHMADSTDYSRIQLNPQLDKQLQQAAKTKQIFIFSNNSREHIDRVSRQVFGKSAEQLEDSGIQIYDITATEHEGYFHPKQSEQGFTLFLEKMNLSGEDCVLFDDSPQNLQAARRQNMKGVLITPEKPLIDYLRPEKSILSPKEKGYEQNH